MKRWTILAALASAAGLFAGNTKAEDVTGVLPKCPVMDKPVNLAVSIATDYGPVFFCCDDCIAKYKKDPAKYAIKVAAQRKALADRLKVQVTCPVTGEPVDRKTFIEHDGKKVFFCCKGCLGKFQEDPDRYKVRLANSYTYQTKCPVMGGRHRPPVVHDPGRRPKDLLLLPGLRDAAFQGPGQVCVEAGGARL